MGRGSVVRVGGVRWWGESCESREENGEGGIVTAGGVQYGECCMGRQSMVGGVLCV